MKKIHILSLTLIFVFNCTAAISKTVLITGANRGLGLELVKQYLEDDWSVLATSRSPHNDEELKKLTPTYSSLEIKKLDVTNDMDLENLASELSNLPIDLIINNAGVLGDPEMQRMGSFNFDSALDIFNTNALGPLRVAQAFYNNLKAGDEKKLINISSIVGSIELTSGNIYFYRASKAALNMMMHNLAREAKKDKIIIGLIHPGVLDTDMTAPFSIDKIPVQHSVQGIKKIIDSFDLEMSGSFLNHKGARLPW